MVLIQDILSKITTEYLIEKKKSTKNNALHRWITYDKVIPESLREILGKEKFEEYHIKASAGEGLWRNVPWITILHRETSLSRDTKNPHKNPPSAKWGFYPGYLFKSDMTEILFGLVQAETNVRKNYPNDVDTILKSRAVILRNKIPEYKKHFKDKLKIQLYDNKEAERWLKGTAFGTIYKTKKLPSEDKLKEDLKEMFELFRKVIEKGGVKEDLPTEIHDNYQKNSSYDQEKHSYEEKINKHIDHEVEIIKTDTSFINKIKYERNYTCEACGLQYEKVYENYSKTKDFIEAHHILPKSQVKKVTEKDTKLIRKKEDFAILCANCHRMIHRIMNSQKIESMDINEFKNRISPRYLELIGKIK